MPATKKQHYVPQFYLRKFADNSGQFFVFDKFTRKQFGANIKDTASGSYFYDFPTDTQERMEGFATTDEAKALEPEVLKRALDPQLVEHELGEIETAASEVFEEMLATIQQTQRIDPSHRLPIAAFLTIQILRTPEFRTTLLQIEQALADRLARDFQLEEHNLRLEVNEQDISIRHASLLFSPSLQQRITDTLLHHIWAIGINTTAQPLFTSDTPVVKQGQPGGGNGFGSPGIEVAFPLTPEDVLILFDRGVYRQLEFLENTHLTLVAENIIHYNSLQIMQSYRHVCCSERKFDLAVQICNEHPELCQIAKGFRYSNHSLHSLPHEDEYTGMLSWYARFVL